MTTVKERKEQFSAFIKVLADRYKPLYIYCFGELTESSSTAGCFVNHSDCENCRYYLLMVMENESRIEHPVQDYVNTHFQYGSITILVHVKETVTAAMKANDRFFITITNGGKLMYSHDQTITSFQVSAYIPTRAADKAMKHHQRCFDLAKGFLEGAFGYLRTAKYSLCLFMLHQVVEQSCSGMIRVYLSYKSDMHNLYRLLSLCDSFSPGLSKFFLGESGEGRILFDLMVRSYAGARYWDNFQVDQASAEKLSQQVSAFFEIAEKLSLQKIEALALEAELHKQTRQLSA